MVIRMKSRRKQKFNNHGFTLVEIMCAVAIFALVVAAMGSIMVYTSKSYSKSSQETEIQQEAQFAANRIGGIVQDSNKVEYTAGTLKMNDGVSEHVVSHNPTTCQLMYTQTASDGSASSGEQLLAENITVFDADVSDFEETRTVKLNMTVEDNGKEYQMSYNMMARNEAASTGTATIVKTASLIVESKLILVPGQTYVLPVDVKGTTAGITATTSGGISASANPDDTVSISAPVDVAKTGDNVFYVNISTNEIGDTGLPLAQAQVTVQIRRVQALKVQHKFVTGSGEEGKAGAKYEFYSSIQKSTPYLAKMLGVTWENDYKNPRAVTWTQEFAINDMPASFDTYFNIKSMTEDVDKPSIVYELKQDLPANSKLTVTAQSKHAAGVNKANSAYDTITAKDELTVSATEITGDTKDVVMEPNQTLEIPVSIAGGESTIICDKSSNSDNSTSASYNDDKVTIKLGKNEKGNASGKFKVSIYSTDNPENKFDINVRVRRVEDISITYNRMSGEDLSAGAVYRFYSSYTGNNMAKASDAEEVTAYVNAYATEFSWEYNVGASTKTSGAYVYNNYGSADASAVYTGDNTNEYIQILSTGVASYQPYIEVKLKQNLPANSEFTMTAKALHPLGNYGGASVNKSGSVYATGIEDSCTLQKEGLMASTKDGIVIVEPGQGIGKDLTGAFAIPIYVSSPIYSIDAQLTGKKSSDTSLWASESGMGYGHKLNDSTWYIKMKVGTDETGNNGKMSLKLSAKNSSGDVLDTEEITLCLRRVTEVAIVSESEIVNAAGSVISLEAKATGYGENGTEYFAQYTTKDAGGNQPVWDRDDYISPYPMEWTVVASGTEKPLSSYATITSTTYTSSKNLKADSGNHKVEFVLTSALPNNSRIRATSRHAAGENKSGKEYDEVYGEIEISGKGPGIGGIEKNADVHFRRGATNYEMYTSTNTFNTVHNMVIEHAAANGGYSWETQGRFFYRFREEGGTWSQYFMFNDETPDKVLMEGYTEWTGRSGQSCIFHPRKAYDFEVMYLVYDMRTNEVHWPWNNVVMTDGYGFKEYGFTFSQFAKDSWELYGETPLEDCVIKDYVPEGTIYFTKDESLGQNLEKSNYLGIHSNEETPLTIKAWSKNKKTTVHIDADYLALIDPESHQGNYQAIVQMKKEDGSWVDVSDEVISGNSHRWSLLTTFDFYDINNIYEADGLYRFGPFLEDWPYAEIHVNEIIDPETQLADMITTYADKNYVELHNIDLEYYDWNTGENVVYAEFDGYAKAGNYALELETKKNGGSVDITSMKSGDYISVKYTESWAGNGVLILQSWTSGNKWIEVEPSQKGDGYTQYTYDDIIKAYGNNLASIDKIYISAKYNDVIANQLDIVSSSGTTNVW